MNSPCLWFAAICAISLYSSASADFRVLPDGEQSKDSRLQPLKDLDGYFPFTPPATPEAWAERAERVRRQIKMAMGLTPEPTRTPLNAVIYGKVDRDNYSVEKVYFESMPGFFVTGSLYRPKNVSDRVPAVLCPHGHWPNGRFMETSDKEVEKEISTGAEKFENAARSPLQARCVQLARMGCVVFHYDMLGYADSVQISMDVAHKFAKQRPEMSTPENWGLFSPQAEAYAQSVMGLQTWNSIRAIDFLQALPEVDGKRIGVTGASGGGTQTMILGALDKRVTAAFPAVMVSTAMQGGCTCENASLLRVGTGNIEFAALFAPKPMAMTAADDWTKELETKGFPELKRLWSMLGAPDKVALTPLTRFPHNYNGPSRAAMYAWFDKHLGLNLSAEQLSERDFQRLTRAELTVWDEQHPAPAGGPEFERKLLDWWRKDTERQLQSAPKESLRENLQTVVGRSFKDVSKATFAERKKETIEEYEISAGVLSNQNSEEQLPTLIARAKDPSGPTLLWLSEQGKAGLFGAENQIRPEVRALLESGINVVAVDLLSQGEFQPTGAPLTETRRVKNPREAAAYTLGYNHSLFAQRTHDALTALRYVSENNKSQAPVGVVALGSTGPIAAAARALAPEVVGPAMLEIGDFDFVKLTRINDPNLQPAIARCGDLSALIALGAPHPSYIIGDSTRLTKTAETYRNAGASGAFATAAQMNPGETVKWLKEQLTRKVSN